MEQVLNYVGRIDERHEFALLKFIWNEGMLADCKKLTVLQEKTVAKFRVKEFDKVQSMAIQVHKAANAIRKHEWPFKQIPKRPEKEERTLDELIHSDIDEEVPEPVSPRLPNEKGNEAKRLKQQAITWLSWRGMKLVSRVSL